MKFLIQIPQLIFGGAEKVLVSFANELAAGGQARIEQQLLVVGDEPLGMFEVDVVRG